MNAPDSPFLVHAVTDHCQAAMEIEGRRVTIFYSIRFFSAQMIRHMGFATDDSTPAIKAIIIELWGMADSRLVSMNSAYTSEIQAITKAIAEAGLAALDAPDT